MFKPVSRPIADTPALYGKAAKKFRKETEKNAHKRTSPEEIERIKRNFEKFKAIQQFE
ncbi:hypothetical protein [Chitinophaga sp. Cy-1792]|uniref:hypothetical protein n=1 Tax=Chitinophaga sp. Cy-1792 TaxID=2608339 RepID=UPI0014206893|nr:hypothetical protein [Chitinophaga sp. Cy-1792]